MKDSYLQLGQPLIFLTENGLFIVTDYQATTNEFGSRPTIVKRGKKKKPNPALISALLIIRMNNSLVWKQATEGGKCKQQPLTRISPKPHNVIVLRKYFFILLVQTSVVYRPARWICFGFFFKMRALSSEQILLCHIARQHKQAM